MIPIASKLEGQVFQLYKLEMLLKPLGYVIGGGWDYERGSFDYKIADNNGYQFLRLPFEAVNGELDTKGAVVRMGTPYVLSHVYEEELDDRVNTLTSAFTSLDQFSEPKNPDGPLDQTYIDIGTAVVREAEETLLTS